MTFSLVWLTVSLPYVDAARKNIAQATASTDASQGQDTENPFSNTTEEKTPGNGGIGEEFLHHMHEMNHPGSECIEHNSSHYSNIYIAFHGELTVPPPEI